MKTKHSARGGRPAKEDRNFQIVSAVRSGESFTAIGRRLGLSGERVSQIARAAGVNQKPHPTKCWCGRELTQETDGNGQVVDVCSVHDRNITGRAPATPSSPSRNGAQPGDGKKCPVENCPGVLDDAGKCECCERRAAWARENLPRRHCEICTGEIEKGKFCLACKPLSLRALAAKKREAA
jgi:hypothetical protein